MKLKKLTGLGLASVAVLGLAACGKQSPTEKNKAYSEKAGASAEKDLDVYEAQLGEFAKAYADAKDAKKYDTDSKRYVAMAKAEAELLSTSVFLPTSTQGGNYAITKVAPRTAPYALWGTDEYRYKNLVVTNEKIKKEDRDALLKAWNEKKGTADYDTVEYSKQYLTGKGYTFSDKYIYQYTEGTKTFDWLATSMTSDSEVLTNIVDGLLEYNGENELVPALAEALPTKTKDADGNAVYTFKIRQGLNWIKNDGTATTYKVTAKDFVTGFQHMLDAEGGLEYLVQGVVKGADEYLTGKTTNFGDVGVKAVDDYTLQYTVLGDPSYFLTYLSYNIYQPLNKEYFESEGGALGKAEFAEAAKSDGYTYGTTKDHVLSCGAYYIDTYADQSTFVFKQNPSYWGKDSMNIKEITWLYNDGKDLLKAYNWLKADQISGAGLNGTAIAEAKKDGVFDTYAYVSDTTATTYFAAYNLNRQTYVLASGAVETLKSSKQAAEANKALNNRNFRLALSYAFDKANWNGQSVGDDLKLNALRNSYTPYSFVSLTEDVTVTVGSETKTYKAGTQYGAVLQDYCTALGLKIDVKDGTNGWYQPEEAKKVMATAVEELAADGLTVSKDNKIHIDVFYYSASKVQLNQANSYKESVEKALGDYVQVDLIPAATTDDYYVCGYRAANGAAANYDVFYGSGWGPDYGDPSTYLDTFLGEGAGYMTKTIGLW